MAKKLFLGKDYVELGAEMYDEKPQIIDIDENLRPVQKRKIQDAVWVYLNEAGAETKPKGKGVVRKGLDEKGQEVTQIIELKSKIEALKGSQIKLCPKTEMEEYVPVGEHEVFRTSLELSDSEAITFKFALVAGFGNVTKAFIYKDVNGDYWLRKTTLHTKAELKKGAIEQSESKAKSLIDVDEQMKLLGLA
jgi:hypothetical protein